MIYSLTFSGLSFFVKATITFSENVQACKEGFNGRAVVLSRYVLYMQRKPHRPLLGQFQDSDAYCAMLDVLENDAGPVRVESTECHPGYAHTMAASEV